MIKLAIIVTHPIQYYVPVFRRLCQQKDLEIMVFYTWGSQVLEKYDPGFARKITWDIPLLDGYPFQWVDNQSPTPGSHGYNGIDNPGLIKQIAQWGADAILVYGWAYKSHLQVMRFFKGKVKVYFRGDSTLLDNQAGARNFLKTILLRWVYRHVDHVFYTGSQNKNYFKKYGLVESHLTFAPHAIDNERFSVPGSVASEIRANFRIGPDEILVLFAGKLEHKKSPEILLNAFRKLRVSNVHLLFVGNGEMEPYLKSLCLAEQVSRVHWLDFQNQSLMPQVYHACDLFCLPSGGPGESWGLSVNEAMAASRATLVSDKAGCAADLVVPGITGEIFKAGNLLELFEKLSNLVTNKERLTTYGEKGRAKIAPWCFDVQVDAMTKTIKNNHAIQ